MSDPGGSVDRGTDYDQGYEDGVRDGDASALLTAVEHRAAVAEAERDQLRDGIEKLCDEADIYLPPPSLILESLRALLAESGTPKDPVNEAAELSARVLREIELERQGYDRVHIPQGGTSSSAWRDGALHACDAIANNVRTLCPPAESRENSE